MNTPKAIATYLLFIMMLAVQNVCAQEHAGSGEKDAPHKVWYGGIEGGVPFGVSTFSSFGADKTRAGYALGLFGGYQFNPVLSVELSAKWGKANLSARDCCVESSYWLGADGVTYHAPVAGFDGADYADLKSAVSLQQYGVRLNVNLLGLFHSLHDSRWKLELSPMLAAVGTKADVKTIEECKSIISDKSRWHLGAGGNLQASYAITERLSLGLFSGITCLTGKGMDGIGRHVHNANYLWESGVRMIWSFGKCRKKATPVQENVPVVAEQPVQPKPVVVQEEPQPEKVVEIPVPEVTEELTFPVIYFDFNKSVIRTSETVKVQAICDILKANPDVKVLVTGWCDNSGSQEVNDNLSLRRAEVVKERLVNMGIEYSRIEVAGNGIDFNATDASKARRVVVADMKRKEVKP